MGMSASQMRYCMLSGKKSDVEFQGQQINQERTTLATQTSAYNNQLLELEVPTPPSSSDYTRTTYTFKSNGEERTVSGITYDSATGTYDIVYTTETTATQARSTGTRMFTTDGTNYLTLGGAVLEQAANDPAADDYETDVASINQICQDCGIEDADGRSYGDPGYVTPTFYKFTLSGTTYFALGSELAENTDGVADEAISTYIVDEDAEITTTTTMSNAAIEWSDSGRMSAITDENGNTYALNISTENDEAAYEDAYNEYEYQVNLYNLEIDEVNAQIDIIQTKDKKLELQLENLDTQQSALSTEMDSVKKVIDKNIETSFKAFA